MAKATRRGNILIEPYKQLRFGIMFLIINLVFSMLVFGVFGYFLWDVYETLSVYFKLDDSQSLITLAKLGQPAGIGLALIIAFIITTLMASARYTHQIYGPMVSIHRFLDDALEGKQPTPIKLRSSDQLKDFADKLNSIAKKIVYSHDQPSVEAINAFLDQLLAKEEPAKLVVAEDDPLYELASKLNRLVSSKQGA